MKNKDEQVSVLDYLNNCRFAKSINSFDFKKLYTNIPHDKVIENVSDLIKRCFDEKKVKYINVSANFKASWSDVVYKIPYRRARAWPSGRVRARAKVSCIQGQMTVN